MSASKLPVQICPICRAQQPLEATRCSMCGARLSGAPTGHVARTRVERRGTRRKPNAPLGGPAGAAWDEGDADLHEGIVPRLPLRLLTLSVAVIALFAVGGLFVISQSVNNPTATPTPPPPSPTVTMVSTVVAAGQAAAGNPTASNATPIPTNTKAAVVVVIPTLALATVTEAPATPTVTPTRGPCVQKAVKGDTIYGMAARCGHKHLSIVPVIVELNGLKDANSLQEGQTLNIPWPTPTGGAPADAGANGGGTPGSAAAADTSHAAPTLPPGVALYTVRKGDTAVGIVARYHITMKTLHDLNPEITFSDCDYGLQTGGAACSLSPVLGEGQKVRVSAPTPTPSLSPTYTGSETVTPTGTATFNAPSSESPDDNMMYDSGDLPALRWTASGKLNDSQVYLVSVRDDTSGQTFVAPTRNLSFQLPTEWQPTDGKTHSYEWFVTVASLDQAGTPVPSALATETRTFTWHSR